MKYFGKLFITFIAVTVVVTGVVFVRVSPPAAAAPSAETCFTKYNNKAYSGKTKTNYNNSGCARSEGGSCSVANAEHPGDSASIVCEDPVASIPDQTDPALDFDNAKCLDAQNCDLITTYVVPLLNFLAAVVALAVVVGIIYGGIQYSTSGGDPQKVADAKNKIRNALIALVTFFFLYAFIQWLVPGGVFSSRSEAGTDIVTSTDRWT